MPLIIEVIGGEMCEAEKQEYVKHVKTQHPGRDIEKLTITIDGDFVN